MNLTVSSKNLIPVLSLAAALLLTSMSIAAKRCENLFPQA